MSATGQDLTYALVARGRVLHLMGFGQVEPRDEVQNKIKLEIGNAVTAVAAEWLIGAVAASFGGAASTTARRRSARHARHVMATALDRPVQPPISASADDR